MKPSLSVFIAILILGATSFYSPQTHSRNFLCKFFGLGKDPPALREDISGFGIVSTTDMSREPIYPASSTDNFYRGMILSRESLENINMKGLSPKDVRESTRRRIYFAYNLPEAAYWAKMRLKKSDVPQFLTVVELKASYARRNFEDDGSPNPAVFFTRKIPRKAIQNIWVYEASSGEWKSALTPSHQAQENEDKIK